MQNEISKLTTLIITIIIIGLVIGLGISILSEQKKEQCGIQGCIKINCNPSHPLYNSSNNQCYNITTTITFEQPTIYINSLTKREVRAL